MPFLRGLFDWIFYPIVHNLSPRWALITISLIITILSTLAYKFLTNQKEMKLLKEEMKAHREEMKTHRSDVEKVKTINQQVMEKNLKYMTHSMRPMIFTFIPIILIFSWLRATFIPAGNLFEWGFYIPLIGNSFGWLWTYFLSSLIFNMTIRKLFKIY